MSKYRITMNGKVYEMEIELIEDQPKINHPTQNTTSVIYKNDGSINPVVQVIAPSAKYTTTRKNNFVESTMPGTIIRVNAVNGDVVEKGQSIITLEAMKMENEITAPRAGVIKEVFVKEGQTVSGGFVLFEMESANETD